MLSLWNSGWSGFDEMFSAMSQLRNYMDRVFEDAAGGRTWPGSALSAFRSTWPKANLLDTGKTLTLTAEVPGLSEKDVQVNLNQDVLTLSGERTVETPEGYSTHRQERPAVQFSRSYTLPCRVSPERASATVKNGILTVTLEKAADAMPRQISVKSA